MRIRVLAAAAAAHVPTLLTLGVLGALTLWGVSNDWKAVPFAHLFGKATEPPPPPPEAVKVVPEQGTGSAYPGATARVMRIEFLSAAAVARAGIDVARAETRDLAQFVTAPGTADYQPERYARLTARASGTVWRVYKEIGDRVHKGDVLALVDAAEVGKYKADFLQSLAQVRVRSTMLERVQGAEREGSVPGRSLLDARVGLREARIRLFNDQQALLNLGLPLRIEDVENLPEDQLAGHLRFLGLPASVRKSLGPETLTANLLPVTAPFDGQVAQRNVAPGEVVQANQPRPLFAVGDISRLHIDLGVKPDEAAAVRLGQTVVFKADKGGASATGEVAHISPEVDAKTRRVTVHAEVDNPEGRLRPNTFGTGRILVDRHAKVVAIPRAAVQSDGGTSLVFVRVSATVFQARPVQLGLAEGDLVEVSGVRPGEEVVTTGSFALKSELLKERIGGGD